MSQKENKNLETIVLTSQGGINFLIKSNALIHFVKDALHKSFNCYTCKAFFTLKGG
ncbi:MAG: hypothetical protein IEMM0003_0523 [bacterium]|nr:MAG: hypothetical protein IEMM0003_0523 [bacterium]